MRTLWKFNNESYPILKYLSCNWQNYTTFAFNLHINKPNWIWALLIKIDGDVNIPSVAPSKPGTVHLNTYNVTSLRRSSRGTYTCTARTTAGGASGKKLDLLVIGMISGCYGQVIGDCVAVKINGCNSLLIGDCVALAINGCYNNFIGDCVEVNYSYR